MFAGLCALNGAFVPAVAKLTTNLGAPLLVALITTIFAGLAAGGVLMRTGQLHVFVDAHFRWKLAAVGFLGTGVAFTLFYVGMSRATAIDAVICLQSEPAYSLLLARVFLGHPPTLRRMIAAGVIVLGIVLAVGARGLSASTGVWLLLATPLCWQVSHLVVLRGLIGVPPLALTGARYIHGSVALAVVWLASGGTRDLPEAGTWLRLLPALVLQGVVLSFGGTLLWYSAITRLDLARTTAIVVPSIPLLSLGASFSILGEVPSRSQCLGLLLVASGVVAFVRAPHAQAPRGRAASLSAPSP